MDYNKQRKIVKVLEAKGKNPLLFLPCLIAKILVIAFMSACRRVDMLLSDSEGNFLGIKRSEKSPRKRSAYEVYGEREAKRDERMRAREAARAEAARAAAKRSAERAAANTFAANSFAKVSMLPAVAEGDEFSERELRRLRGSLPYRSFGARCASFGLAAAFALMILPEVNAGAVTISGAIEHIFKGTGNVTYLDVQNYCDELIDKGEKPFITAADLYGGNNDVMLDLEPNAFVNMPTLTMVSLGYSVHEDEFGHTTETNVQRNFTNIGGGDATLFVHSNFADDNERIGRQLSGNSKDNLQVVHDPSGAIWNEAKAIPNVTAVEAVGAVGSVNLRWNAVSSQKGIDGYAVYRVTKNSNDDIASIDRIGYFYSSRGNQGGEYVYDTVSGGKCSASITVNNNSSDCFYAVRAFRNNVGVKPNDPSDDYKLFSPLFGITEKAAGPLKIGKAPTLKAIPDGFYADIEITGIDPKADYIKLFRSEETKENNFRPEDYVQLDTINIGNRTEITYQENERYNIRRRQYIAVMVYDPLGEYRRETNFVELSNIRSQTAAAVVSNYDIITRPAISAPTNFKAVINDDDLVFSWQPTTFIPGMSTGDAKIVYRLYVDGKQVERDAETSPYTVLAANYLNGKNAAAEIEALYISTDQDGEIIARSNRVTYNITVNAPQIDWVKAGNNCFTIKWLPFAGAMRYVVHWDNHNGISGSSPTISDQQAQASEYTYEVTGLANGVPYDVWITADVRGSSASTVWPVTPSPAPGAPQNLSAVPESKAVTLKWDPTSDPNVSYRIEVFAGENPGPNDVPMRVIRDVKKNTEKVGDLVNGAVYTFRVWAVKKVDNNAAEGIDSLTAASTAAIPSPNIGEMGTVTVVPQDTVIKISWNSVQGATKYYLRKTSDEGTQVIPLGNVTSYVDEDVSNDKLYSYAVKAVNDKDGADYPSDGYVNEHYSSEYSGKINVYVPPVQGLKATAADGKVTLEWEKVDKADGYIIQASVGDNMWQEITRVNTNKYEHTGLINGREYQYKVTAYRLVNRGKELVLSTSASAIASSTPGLYFPAPYDFTVTAGDGQVNLSWTAVKDAEGYEVYVEDIYGTLHRLDVVTKNSAVHMGLSNGATITYCVRAFKTVSGEKVYSDYTIRKTVVVGTYLNAPTDIVIKTGDGKVDISWKKSDGAEGYVVYSYNPTTSSFTPVGIVTGTSFSHTGLVNGRTYTYMVAGYKTVNGEIKYSPYSLAATAVPEGTGNKNNTNNTNNRPGTSNSNPGDYRIYITGTTPYGMSNSNLISAFAENGAFNEDIDVRFTWSAVTNAAVQDVLDFYGGGIESFMIYPMDISLYKAGTDQKININTGYYLTLTIPVPDELLPYSEAISVVHISDDEQLEILPSTHVTVSGVDCMQFQATSFSPYAFVVYLPQNGEDLAAGSFAVTSVTMEYETTSAPVLMCTVLPDIYGRRKRNKVYRIVK